MVAIKVGGADLPHGFIEGMRHHHINAKLTEQLCLLLRRRQVITPGQAAQHEIRVREQGQDNGPPVSGMRFIDQLGKQMLVAAMYTIKNANRNDGRAIKGGVGQVINMLHGYSLLDVLIIGLTIPEKCSPDKQPPTFKLQCPSLEPAPPKSRRLRSAARPSRTMPHRRPGTGRRSRSLPVDRCGRWRVTWLPAPGCAGRARKS